MNPRKPEAPGALPPRRSRSIRQLATLGTEIAVWTAGGALLGVYLHRRGWAPPLAPALGTLLGLAAAFLHLYKVIRDQDSPRTKNNN